MIEILENKISDKLDAIDESISYQIEALVEFSSALKMIKYMLFLKNTIKKKK